MALAILWMAMMFFFSGQDGDTSSDLSRTVTEYIVSVIKPRNSSEAFFSIHFFVRKTAHFTEYAILGVLWSLVLATYPRLKGSRGLIALIISILWAVLDEFHQSFVSGRTPAITDVCIDSAGALFGILITAAAFWLFGKIRLNRKNPL